MTKEGYILLAKQIIDSEIWLKPAEYLKIWIYILQKVNYCENKKTGQERGEGFFNFRQEKIPHVSLTQIYEFLRWAKIASSTDCPTQKTTMITTRKTTRGIYIKVNNYNKFQNIENYILQHRNQHRNQHENQQLPNTISKRNKEISNTSYINISSSSSIGKEDEEILKKYSKEKNKIKCFRPWLRKITANGDLDEVLEKAREWHNKQILQQVQDDSKGGRNEIVEITPEEDAKIREIQEKIKKRRRI